MSQLPEVFRVCDGVLWENQSWTNFSNSTDNFLVNSNSENSTGGGGSDEAQKEMMELETGGHHDHHLLLQPEVGPSEKAQAAKKNGGLRGGSAGTKNGKTAKGKGKRNSDEVAEGRKVGGDSDDHELHIYTERERRKKMRNMFSNLHSLLPQLPSKADKSTIVDEAVSYIRRLESNLQSLQQEKIDRIRNLTGSTMINNNFEPLHFVASSGSLATTPTTSSTPTGLFNKNPNFNHLNNSVLSTDVPPIGFQASWSSSNVALNLSGEEAQITVSTPKRAGGVFTNICTILDRYNLLVVSAHINSDSDRSFYMFHTKSSKTPDKQILEIFTTEEIYKHAMTEIMAWVDYRVNG